MSRLLLPAALLGLVCLFGCRAKPAIPSGEAQVFPGTDIELEVDEVPAVYIFIGSRDLKLVQEKT